MLRHYEINNRVECDDYDSGAANEKIILLFAPKYIIHQFDSAIYGPFRFHQRVRNIYEIRICYDYFQQILTHFIRDIVKPLWNLGKPFCRDSNVNIDFFWDSRVIDYIQNGNSLLSLLWDALQYNPF